jgi:hypothetical protein
VGVLTDSSVINQPEDLVVGYQAAIDELAGGALPDKP